jgi:transcriptional regulator with XRE-family HTH domain
MPPHYGIRKFDATAISAFVVDAAQNYPQALGMFDTKGLLAALERKGISKADMARALNLPSPRITEMYSGKRRVLLDEAKRLVDAFRLDQSDQIEPISEGVARLLALHIANRLGKPLSSDDPLVQELAEDLQAFSNFARRQSQAPTADAAAGFLAGRQSGLPSRH